MYIKFSLIQLMFFKNIFDKHESFLKVNIIIIRQILSNSILSKHIIILKIQICKTIQWRSDTCLKIVLMQ